MDEYQAKLRMVDYGLKRISGEMVGGDFWSLISECGEGGMHDNRTVLTLLLLLPCP